MKGAPWGEHLHELPTTSNFTHIHKRNIVEYTVTASSARERIYISLLGRELFTHKGTLLVWFN